MDNIVKVTYVREGVEDVVREVSQGNYRGLHDHMVAGSPVDILGGTYRILEARQYALPEGGVAVTMKLLAEPRETVRAAGELSDLELLYGIDILLGLGDRVYTVREREGLGWDGPEVKRYGELVDEMRKRFRSAGIVATSKEF